MGLFYPSLPRSQGFVRPISEEARNSILATRRLAGVVGQASRLPLRASRPRGCSRARRPPHYGGGVKKRLAQSPHQTKAVRCLQTKSWLELQLARGRCAQAGLGRCNPRPPSRPRGRGGGGLAPAPRGGG